MRLFGLLATSLLLGVGATAAITFAPDGGGESATPRAAPAATPAPAAAERPEARKPKFTRAERRARAAAAATLRDQGYRPVDLSDYDPKHVLRVLIGRGDGGQRAFFFAGARYLGNDVADDSRRIRVVRAGNRSVALSYRLYGEGGGYERVLFRWDGEELTPQTSIPSASARG
jgi:hypothetical protein